MNDVDPKTALDAIEKLAGSTALAVVAKTTYPDLLQPSAKQAGVALETVASMINVALRPVKTAMLGISLVFDKADAWLINKFKDTPPEKIVSPPPNIAAPALLQLALIDGDERMNDLRALFLELLASAMHLDKQPWAHPAFVEIVKQMSPAEAKFIHLLSENRSGGQMGVVAFPTVEGRIKNPNGSYTPISRSFHFGFDDSFLKLVHLDNLERLRIVLVDDDTALREASGYEKILADIPREQVERYQEWANSIGGKVIWHRGTIKLTNLGNALIHACTDTSSPPDDGQGSGANPAQ